jgi:uncharacterized RDD family membrane protein YckC
MPLQKNDMFDSSLEALTPEGIEFVLFPAGLPVRTLAYTIDKILQWIIILTSSITISFLRDSMGIWFALILNFVVDWFYHVICELAFRGQSLGKHMTGIRVVKSDGSPVDPASSFLRNLLRFADTFFFCFPIAFISMAASRGFRRIGDWAGGTLVVYSSLAKNNPRNSLSRILEKYEPVIPARPLSHGEKQAILNFARRYPLLGEARANEIAGIYAPYLKDSSILSDDALPGTAPANSALTNAASTDAAFLLGIARKLSGEI